MAPSVGVHHGLLYKDRDGILWSDWFEEMEVTKISCSRSISFFMKLFKAMAK